MRLRLTDYDKAIELNPDDAGTYGNRGNTDQVLGNYEDAIADYDKVIELRPNDPGAYNNRGNANAALGNYEASVDDCDKCD